MYRLIIVEDEDSMREGLEKYIPWNQFGFEVVQTFEDGDIALKWMEEHQCDVILSDIVMGQMDGLELAEQVNKSYPDVAFVILSGYNRFEYARQALRNQVADYLLKPLDDAELARVFRTLKTRLDERNNQELSVVGDEMPEIIKLLRRSFFQLLLVGQITSETQLNMYLRLLKLPNTTVQRPLLAYEVDIPDEKDAEHDECILDTDEWLAKLRSFFCDMDRSDEVLYEVTRIPNGNARVIMIAASDISLEGMQRIYKDDINLFNDSLKAIHMNTVSCLLTHIVKNMRELCKIVPVYHKQERLRDGAEDDNELFVHLISYTSILIVELDLNHPEEVLCILRKIMSQLANVSIERIRFVLNNLMVVVEVEYMNRGIDTKLLTRGAFDASRALQANDADECAELLETAFAALCDGLDSLYQSFRLGSVGRIIQYVFDNISSDLSREEMANELHFHPVSISRIFRQQTGESLSAFILRVKMERAIVLLKDKSLSIRDICSQLGYSSSTYFNNTFKKYTGFSPREYYNRMLL